MCELKGFRQEWLLLVLLTIGGCGGETGPEKYTVSGQVTLDGEPLKEGSITFHSVEKGGDSSAGPITLGEYSLTSSVGAKKVEVTANRHVPDKKDALGMPVTEQYIPKQYNSQTTLTAEVEKGANTADFDLKSK